MLPLQQFQVTSRKPALQQRSYSLVRLSFHTSLTPRQRRRVSGLTDPVGRRVGCSIRFHDQCFLSTMNVT